MDKLARLQTEFHYRLEVAKQILLRETVKEEVVQQAQAVWKKRLTFSDLTGKRKFRKLLDILPCVSLLSFGRRVPVSKPRRTIIVPNLSYDPKTGLLSFVNKLRPRWSDRRPSTITEKTW